MLVPPNVALSLFLATACTMFVFVWIVSSRLLTRPLPKIVIVVCPLAATIPLLFVHSEVILLSDGNDSRTPTKISATRLTLLWPRGLDYRSAPAIAWRQARKLCEGEIRGEGICIVNQSSVPAELRRVDYTLPGTPSGTWAEGPWPRPLPAREVMLVRGGYVEHVHLGPLDIPPRLVSARSGWRETTRLWLTW